MANVLPLSAGDRLLVFAPHPDDETLAAGELIQSAVAVGAAVRVVFATDGDNNPWPQRWLERRFRIGAAERARWGQRRRGEALGALEILGIDASSARFLGWPDQGLTAALMHDDGAISTLAQEIAAFVPSRVAMPTLDDRHPDHSALRVMLELALMRCASTCHRLGYIVHGARGSAVHDRIVAAGPESQTRKQRAMLAHASQVALSRRRLLAIAAAAEKFELAEKADRVPLPEDKRAFVQIPYRTRPPWHRGEELLAILAFDTHIARFRIPLLPGGRVAQRSTDGLRVELTPTAGGWRIDLPGARSGVAAMYLKRERCGPRLVIFDEQGWFDAARLLQPRARGLALARAAAESV